MDVRYINAFIRSTRQVFADMVRVPLTSGKAFAKPAALRIQNEYPLSAVIAFHGPAEGIVVLSVTEAVAISIATGLMGDPISKLGEDCDDAIAEVANMIAGGAKKEVSSTPVTITIPKVMRTDNVIYPAGMPVLILPFATPTGKLVIQVAMKKGQVTAAAPAAAAQQPQRAKADKPAAAASSNAA